MSPTPNNVDAWLEEELRRAFVPFSSAPLPVGAPYRSRRFPSAAAWSAARMATRIGVIVLAATCGMMATGALAAAAVTGTPDPADWTFHLTMTISTCTGQVAVGQSAPLGACVDAMVHYRGQRSFEERAREGSGSGRSLASPVTTTTAGPSDKKGGPDSPPGPAATPPLGAVPAGPPTPIENAPTALTTPQRRAPAAQPTLHGPPPTAPSTTNP